MEISLLTLFPNIRSASVLEETGPRGFDLLLRLTVDKYPVTRKNPFEGALRDFTYLVLITEVLEHNAPGGADPFLLKYPLGIITRSAYGVPIEGVAWGYYLEGIQDDRYGDFVLFSRNLRPYHLKTMREHLSDLFSTLLPPATFAEAMLDTDDLVRWRMGFARDSPDRLIDSEECYVANNCTCMEAVIRWKWFSPVSGGDAGWIGYCERCMVQRYWIPRAEIPQLMNWSESHL